MRLRLTLLLGSFVFVAFALPRAASAACINTNTCEGTGALQSNVDGADNSAFGYQALGADVHGSRNTAVGSRALQNTKSIGLVDCDQFDCDGGVANTAVGYSAMAGNVDGSGNTATGFLALGGNGKFNVANGVAALRNNGTGTGNTAIGGFALLANQGAGFNTATGFDAMAANTTGGNNTASGVRALRGFNWDGGDKYRQRGSFNAAFGMDAMAENDTGGFNTAIGYQSLVGSGEQAGIFQDALGMSGNFNTASGAYALHRVSSGSSNTATGYQALQANTTGLRNTAAGRNALGGLTTGVRNIAIGAGAGKNVVSGSDNIILGADNLGTAAENGVIRIGNGTFQKKAFVAGVSGVTTGLPSASAVFIDANGQLGTIKSSLAYKEDIHSLGDVSDRIYALRPVSFRYKEPFEDGSKPVQYGLIAEDVASVFPELVVYDAEGKPETVAYHLLATLLLNEVQKGRKLAEAQALRIADLEKQAAELAKLKQEMAQLAETLARLDRAARSGHLNSSSPPPIDSRQAGR